MFFRQKFPTYLPILFLAYVIGNPTFFCSTRWVLICQNACTCILVLKKIGGLYLHLIGCAVVLAGQTSDLRVTGSTPALDNCYRVITLGKLFTPMCIVPLSPRSVIWYRRKLGSKRWVLRCTGPVSRNRTARPASRRPRAL